MQLSPPFFWLAQAGILGVWGLAWFLMPGLNLSLLTGTAKDLLAPEAIDQLRMSSPYLLGLAGFSVFGAMTRRTKMKRSFGIVFGIVFTLWSIANWMEIGRYVPLAWGLALVPTLLAVGNLSVAFRKPPEWERAENAGTSSTKPGAAFGIWMMQGTVLLSGASAFYFMPEMTLKLITADPSGDLGVAIHQTRLLGALSAGMGLFSFVAVRSQRSFAWRGFAFFFVVFMSIWTVSIFWILGQGDYALPVLSVLVPGLMFFPMNLWIGRQHGEFDPGDVNRRSEVWTARDLMAGPLMAVAVFLTRRRSSHGLGVGARGTFKPTLAPGVPPNDFFSGEADAPVQVRFANLTQLDDAALDVRGCAIKFSDEPYQSPLDLLMNTGSFCPSTNLATFASFVASKMLPKSMSERALRKNLPAREGGIAGLRRAPSSYSSLRYYGQITRFWSEPNGQRHLVRYRCVPESGPEDGLPSPEDAAHIWIRDRLTSETRATDYLRREIVNRLGKGSTLR